MIRSFEVNHLNLKPGLYVSIHDVIGNSDVITYDLRLLGRDEMHIEAGVSNMFYELFGDEAIEYTTRAFHTLEHFLATAMRNRFPEETVYVGPMGCNTGMYLVVKGDNTFKVSPGEKETPSSSAQNSIKLILIEVLESIKSDMEIPGATLYSCGNPTLQSRKGAALLLENFLKNWETGKIEFQYN